MKYRLPLVIAALLAGGCAGTKPAGEPTRDHLPDLSNLVVTPSDRALTLAWNVARDPGHVFSGYNIYISRDVLPETGPLGTSVSPINDVPYPGDTDGDPSRETYEADDLRNGVRYHCMVRPVGVDGREGKGITVPPVICRPDGEVALQPVFSGGRDGFDFARGRYVDTDADGCHIAFYVKDGRENIVSPSRIEPLLGETRFWDVGEQADFSTLRTWSPPDEGNTQVTARRGHLYVYRTATAHYGKFWITDISDEDGERTIHFRYMYQTIPDLIDLR